MGHTCHSYVPVPTGDTVTVTIKFNFVFALKRSPVCAHC